MKKKFKPSPDVIEILKRATETFNDRESKYGATRYVAAKIQKVLYPNGIHLITERDFLQYQILQMVIGKIVRFVHSGDSDSAHDAGLYSFLLESIALEFDDE